MTISSIFLAIASLLAGLGVAAGAFASHALKSSLTEKALLIWETGTKYQMYHALALLLVAVLISNEAAPLAKTGTKLDRLGQIAPVYLLTF